MRWPLAIILLVFLAALTRFWHIDDLPYAVFDEMYNVTMSTQYLSGRPFIDVHPPVARFHFAAAAALAGAQSSDRLEKTAMPFGSFPYQVLRSVSAVAGILLVLIIIVLTKEVSRSKTAALLAGFLVIFDNSLTLYSRLILPDIFLLLYGAAGLYCYFRCLRYPRYTRAWYGWLAAAAVLFSLSAGVKATGWIFPGIAFLHSLFQVRRDDLYYPYRMFAWLLAVPFVLITFYTLIHFLLLDSTGPVYAVISNDTISSFSKLREHNPIWRFGKWPALVSQRAGETFLGMVSGVDNSVAGGNATASAPWRWPLMQKPMIFIFSRLPADTWKIIYLVGNPIIWWSGLLALPVWLRRVWLKKEFNLELLVLALGYLGYMAGVTLIRRPLYLYNYFPALLFLLVIVSSLAASLGKTHPRLSCLWLAAILAGFIYLAPYTYAIPLSTEQVNARAALIPYLSPPPASNE